MSVTDGTEKVIEPPKADGQEWYPFTVSWSPDGTTLLYEAGTQVSDGVIAVPADKPSNATVLIHSVDPVDDNHRWSATQMWDRATRREESSIPVDGSAHVSWKR